MLKKYSLMNPLYRGLLHWASLTLIGFLRLNHMTLPYYHYLIFIGALIFAIGQYIYYLGWKINRQVRKRYDQIEYIANEGIYEKIRHPCYLGIMLMYIGVGILWGSYISLCFAIFLSGLLVIVAIEEEKALCERFEEYKKYMKKVKWRFIPGLF